MMNKYESDDTEPVINETCLLGFVPAVLRARGFRLYTQDTKRLVDLWQNGGAAVLGHTPPNVLRELKNYASRGLFSPLPHFLHDRYLKALSKLFPGYAFRIYSNPPPALGTLFQKSAAGLWRPFVNIDTLFEIADNAPSILVPVLPGIQSWRDNLPQGLCVLAAQSQGEFTRFPQSDTLPPYLLAAATRGVYGLIAASARGELHYPRINKALQNSRWKRTGIYLVLKNEPDTSTYNMLFQSFLDAGFLLPPYPSHPLILPAELSDGEESKLAAELGT
ncbi:MAG: hypothetical protein LBB81_06535 [Treponema sp.]|jgi:hypothetical protein|nr:hypothetical protein [Treponema sp.]